ncbi:MAG TPA: hypothetical protein VEL73_08545 [Mycobacteriales bacterium]|nr:hypothetical protein [Mycobacteriales bacterium]
MPGVARGEVVPVVRKKMEGNEDQRRKAARIARALGKKASQLLRTTGASKQPHRLARHGWHQHEHDLRIASVHAGKQQALSAMRRKRV